MNICEPMFERPFRIQATHGYTSTVEAASNSHSFKFAINTSSTGVGLHPIPQRARLTHMQLVILYSRILIPASNAEKTLLARGVRVALRLIFWAFYWLSAFGLIRPNKLPSVTMATFPSFAGRIYINPRCRMARQALS